MNIFGLKGFRGLSARLAVLAVVVAAAGPAPSLAQERYVIDRAQEAVRERIVREQGGNAASVTFPGDWRTDTYSAGNYQTGVRGEGRFKRDAFTRAQRFTYDAVVNTRNGRVQRVNYNLMGRYDDDVNDNYDDRNDRAPRWLVGTFRGRNPSGRQGQYVTVTIGRGGDVTLVHETGTREAGNYVNGQIQFTGRPSWDVARVGDGFRATSRRRSEDFTRTSGGDYPGGGGNADVPRWMVGTFRGTTDSGESELTIRADGSASARSLRTGETFYGRYSDRLLRFDWGDFEVTRERDGIRTIELRNRNNQTYYRRERGY